MGNLFENIKIDIISEGVKITVTEHSVNDQQIYRLTFSDDRLPLVITRITTFSGSIWTSVPQGRQKEAELYCNKILEYLKK